MKKQNEDSINFLQFNNWVISLKQLDRMIKPKYNPTYYSICFYYVYVQMCI